MVKIDNVTFHYGTTINIGVSDINLDIKKGECILLCGKSGCGKTTITKLINGLIPHFETGEKEGHTFIKNKKIDDTELYELSLTVASVFQNPKSQFFNLDVESEILFTMENQGVSIDIMDSRLQKTVKDLDIGHLMNKNMFEMSGGEKQVIAFACAYASNPDIIVLDEPSANLDLSAIEMISSILKKLKALGKTIIISEHRISYLNQIVDKVCYIEKGKILNVYTSDEFYSINDYKRKLLGLRQLKDNDELSLLNTRQYINNENTHTLKVKNIEICYKGKSVLQNINFELKSGEIVGLIGKNGTGKSSLSRCICGLCNQKFGKIYFDGIEVKNKLRQKESYIVMQDVNHQLFAESVEEECFLGNKKVDKEKVHDLLKELNLYDMKEMHPQSLSGGQKQRLAIAVALLCDKKILIFDEPTSGLDYANMIKVSKLINKLSEKGYIILIVTHDMEFLELTCNKCILLDKDRATDITKELTEISNSIKTS